MARLHTSGFETGKKHGIPAYDGETNNDVAGGIDHYQTGTINYQNTVARNSGYALSCAPGAANYLQIRDVVHVADRNYYVRFYLRINASPSTALQLWVWRFTSVASDIRINTSRQLQLRNAAGTQIGALSSALSVDTWYMIEARIKIPTSGNGEAEARVNGVTFASSSSTNVGTTVGSTTHRLGHQTSGESACTIYCDDLAINDDQGSEQNSWPGPGNVSLLLPYVDWAVGTGWVAGAGGATLYPAVSNIPPAGVITDSATNTSQIKNATSLSSTSTYYAVCQSLEQAGVPAGSVMKVYQALARVSTDDATGTNTMEVRSVYPSDTAITVDAELGTIAGDDSSTAATGWKSARTAPTYSPGLPSNQPTIISISKTLTGSTRQHQADLMGSLVEWVLPTNKMKMII